MRTDGQLQGWTEAPGTRGGGIDTKACTSIVDCDEPLWSRTECDHSTRLMAAGYYQMLASKRAGLG